jgi:sec-independent protein translocase protein TatA
MTLTHGVLALSFPGGMEWVVILVVGLLIFGKRLPEVARSFGKSITEFKKGMRDVTDDIHSSIDRDAPSTPRIERNRDAVPASKDHTPPELQ